MAPLKCFTALALAVVLLYSPAVAAQRGDRPRCEWCGAQDAPDNLTSVMTIASDREPGERIVLRGRVFMPDGVTPAPGVLVYAYHTDITGRYRRDGNETGNGLRHGALRGWLRTDDEGRYEIRTIKPGRYPNRTQTAHIHITFTPPGGEEDWTDSYLFEGDPALDAAEIEQSASMGRFGFIMHLQEQDSVLVGERDLRLGHSRRK